MQGAQRVAARFRVALIASLEGWGQCGNQRRVWARMMTLTL
jgi:hypothetical protein